MPEGSVRGDIRSIPALLRWRVKETPKKKAFTFPDKGEVWQSMNWREVGDRVRKIAMGLNALGIASEERVAILSATRVEWILADLGILGASAACTTIYPSNTAEECAYIITDSKTKMVFAENKEQFEKLKSKKDELGVENVIVFDAAGVDDEWAMSLADLEALGEKKHKEDPEAYDKIVDSITLDKLATLIYTSGTTGKPKGVELLHDCWVYTGEAMEKVGVFKEDDVQFLWLPMSHSFGKVLEVSTIQCGVVTAVDGRVPNIVENLGRVRPTWMGAPPRIFEKVYNKIVSGAEQAGGMKLKIFRWALKVGKEVSALKQKGQEPLGLLALKYKLANKLVFSKLTTLFGVAGAGASVAPRLPRVADRRAVPDARQGVGDPALARALAGRVGPAPDDRRGVRGRRVDEGLRRGRPRRLSRSDRRRRRDLQEVRRPGARRDRDRARALLRGVAGATHPPPGGRQHRRGRQAGHVQAGLTRSFSRHRARTG